MNNPLQNATVFIISSLLSLTVSVAAQDKPSPASIPQAQQGASMQPTITVEQNAVFFNNYRVGKYGPGKGTFETTEEYKKRLSAPWDTNKTVYFKVDGNSLWGDTQYKYDADSQIMTAIAGKEQGLKISYSPRGATSVLLQEYEIPQGSYEGSNAFGVTVKVEKSTYIDYALNFMNLKKCPKFIFNKDNSQFTITIKKDPKAAEELSKNLEIIVGVKLLGYKYSDSEVASQSRTPTIDRPYEYTTIVSVIDANLIKVILCNKTSREVLAEYDMNQE